MTTPATLKNRPNLPQGVLPPGYAGDTLTIPWAEDMTDEQPIDINFASDGTVASVSLKIWIYWQDRFQAFKEILGYSYVNAASPAATGLSRVPPWRCPHFPWLRATRIASSKVQYHVPPVDPDNKFGEYNNWLLLGLTVIFGAIPYPILADEQMDGDELDRYVDVRYESYTRSLNPNTKWTYDDATRAESNGKDATAKGDAGLLVETKAIFLTWFQVPWDYIHNASGVTSAFDACAGRINGASYLGYPAGTLLCEPPKVEKQAAPLFPEAYGQATGDPPIYAKVGVTLKHFDPDTTSTVRGWNLLPDTHYADKWTLVKNQAGRRLYSTADFGTLFDQAT